jgi:site-specific recombinase XerD
MHALRHLVASSILQQGVSIKELATFLGHADEAFTGQHPERSAG